VLFALVSSYLALIIVTRVDHIFFPGNELTLPSAVRPALPLVDADGDSAPEERINILVVGLDKRPSDGDAPTRTDTVFIVTVDPKTKSSGILGIPRDLVVDVPYQDGDGTYEERINAVYVAGELNGYDQGGIDLLKEVIELNFDVEISKYVMVDFEGFEEIIDALGGIDVDVPDEVYDPYYSRSELPGDYDPQYFEPGTQHMDGETALAYARIRFSSDDLDRIQRQQRVIFATIEGAKSRDVLSNAPELWSKYRDAIKTDINDFLIAGYAKLANDVIDDIHAVSLGPATVPCMGPGGAAWMCGDDESIARIVRSVFVDQPGSLVQPETTPEPVRVQVQNGTGVEGLATRVVNFIATRGYPQNDLYPANVYDGALHDVSLIIDIDGTHEKNRLLIANWLGIDLENARPATPDEAEALAASEADIIVIIGADFDEQRIEGSAVAGAGG
jgi:LCP family protein required for cell wall assembly